MNYISGGFLAFVIGVCVFVIGFYVMIFGGMLLYDIDSKINWYDGSCFIYSKCNRDVCHYIIDAKIDERNYTINVPSLHRGTNIGNSSCIISPNYDDYSTSNFRADRRNGYIGIVVSGTVLFVLGVFGCCWGIVH